MEQKRNISIENTPNLYWKCQLIGWSIASVYWAYNGYFKNECSVSHTFIMFIFDVLIGISITHLYKLNHKKSRLELFKKGSFFRLAISIIVLAILFMLLGNLKWHLYWVVIKGIDQSFTTSMLFWDPILITGLRLMSIWVLAYHLYHYYRQQIALTEYNAQLSIFAKQVQLDHLSNQLNPHFLFNSLNSVKSLISEDSSKAKRSVDLLSDILRFSIYTKDSFASIEDELQVIYDYIELEKLRFENRLQLNVELDDTLLDFKIPSLCIQTLIENALKHGIQKSIKGGTILLSIVKKEENIEISVQNPGQLIIGDETENTGLGLKNLKKRLQLQYRKMADFTLVEQPKGIITATIILPLNSIGNE